MLVWLGTTATAAGDGGVRVWLASADGMRPGVNHVMLQRRAAVELLVLTTSTAMFLLLQPTALDEHGAGVARPGAGWDLGEGDSRALLGFAGG